MGEKRRIETGKSMIEVEPKKQSVPYCFMCQSEAPKDMITFRYSRNGVTTYAVDICGECQKRIKEIL